MVCLGHPSLPPTYLGRLDDEEASTKVVSCTHVLELVSVHLQCRSVVLVTSFLVARKCQNDCHGWLGCSQSGRPIFDDFSQHLWPYIGNNTANVCLPNGQAFVAYPHRPMTLHSPTENSLEVLNHKILEVNSQVQNVKLGGHQTCLSINRLWHELCDMLRRLVGTTAPGHHDCSIQE
ncbi:uncharacterized protein TNCV_3343011 [Trichonephila clavipes]|nr:uncharacterized protein TNCV_3343011 [Trichonephila clavipes]